MKHTAWHLLVTICWSALLGGCAPPDTVRPSLPELLESPDFELTDENGESFSSRSLEGKVWLVDFIFTRCGGPCPLMTQRMVSLQQTLQAEGLVGGESDRVRLISITVDPAYDTPEILSAYAELWNADTTSWTFLTGAEEYTLSLIGEGFKITARREGSGTDSADIAHSTNFLLIDGNGWVRRIAHLDEEPFQESLVQDIRQLLRETAG